MVDQDGTEQLKWLRRGVPLWLCEFVGVELTVCCGCQGRCNCLSLLVCVWDAGLVFWA